MTELFWESLTVDQPIPPAELADLWRKQAGILEAFAATRCDSPEDCVQEAFIKLASIIPVPRDPVAWLYQVVRNLALNNLRATVRRRNLAATLASSLDSQTGPPPEAALQKQQTEQALQIALQELPADQHEIVIAHVWGGLTFRQIGAAQGISHAAAHRHYQLALDVLRSTLHADDIRILESNHASKP